MLNNSQACKASCKFHPTNACVWCAPAKNPYTGVRAVAAIGTKSCVCTYMNTQFKENAEREFRGGKVNPSGRPAVCPSGGRLLLAIRMHFECMRSPTPEPAVLGYARAEQKGLCFWRGGGVSSQRPGLVAWRQPATRARPPVENSIQRVVDILCTAPGAGGTDLDFLQPQPLFPLPRRLYATRQILSFGPALTLHPKFKTKWRGLWLN